MSKTADQALRQMAVQQGSSAPAGTVVVLGLFWDRNRFQHLTRRSVLYFLFADHTPSGEPISRGCECNGDFRQLASGSKDLCILASVM
jgi:hypothetical protein